MKLIHTGLECLGASSIVLIMIVLVAVWVAERKRK